MIEKELAEISFNELDRIWNVIKKFRCVVIRGWAAHILINENFRRERNMDYIGSRDIDFAVLSDDLVKVFEAVEQLGFFPLSFRYCRIYSRSQKRFIQEAEASKYPAYDLFYLFVDFITDKKPNVNFMIFEDEIIEFMFDNGLFLEKSDMRIILPELLVLSKLRMLKERSEEKRIKDIIDALMVYAFYENFNNSIFEELAEKFEFDKTFVKHEVDKVDEYLKMLGFVRDEIVNLKVSFRSLIE